MEQFIIDTNVISHYFSGRIPVNALTFIDSVIDAVPNLSLISKIELLSWKTEDNIEEKIKHFIDDSNVFDVTDSIVARCIELRRNYKIKTPDALIAATALVLECTLITNNFKDFQNIKGLKIINPMNINTLIK
jgi:predicted nucleic acid-binding protein